MTPQEIADYKQRWMCLGNNDPIRIHSDLAIQSKEWCRRHLERHQWKMDTYSDVYEHTFYFEHDKDCKAFCEEFSDWINT